MCPQCAYIPGMWRLCQMHPIKPCLWWMWTPVLSSSIHTSCECRTKAVSEHAEHVTHCILIGLHIIVLLYSMISMVWYGSTCPCTSCLDTLRIHKHQWDNTSDNALSTASRHRQCRDSCERTSRS